LGTALRHAEGSEVKSKGVIIAAGCAFLSILTWLGVLFVLDPGNVSRPTTRNLATAPAEKDVSRDPVENRLKPFARKKDDVSIVLGLDPDARKKGEKAAVQPTPELISAANFRRPTAVATRLPDIESPGDPDRGLLGSLEEAGERIDRPRVIFGPGDSLTTTQLEVVGPPPPAAGPAAQATPGLPRISGQARGYAMLYMMHPRARATVEREVQAMLDSQVNDLYLGVLTDGTFGQDYEYLNSIIQRLVVDGRRLTLAIYLTNGATMRDWDRTPITASFNQIEPGDFRYLIRYDPDTRNTFKRMVAEAIPSFELNLRLNPGGKNIAIVMLEDNLDAESYFQMRELARSVLGNRADFVRNPCNGCYEGNDSDTLGDPLEVHTTEELLALKAGDGFTLDGTGYSFPGEPPGRMSTENVKEILALSRVRQHRYFGLWRLERQGLGKGKLHPDQREYEVPTDAQIALEVEMLRHGLTGSGPPTPIVQPTP
jgi:hypothetical protein